MRVAFRQLFLDFLSAIVFVILYAVTDNLWLATGVALAVSIAQILIATVRGEPVDAMQWLVLVLVLVLGAATLITNDSRYIMLKPTLTHSAVALVMLRRGWMARYMPPVALEHLSQRFIVVSGYCWAALMFALALTNLVVAMDFSFEVWGWFVGFGLFGSKFLAVLVLYVIGRTLISRKLRAASRPAA